MRTFRSRYITCCTLVIDELMNPEGLPWEPISHWVELEGTYTKDEISEAVRNLVGTDDYSLFHHQRS